MTKSDHSLVPTLCVGMPSPTLRVASGPWIREALVALTWPSLPASAGSSRKAPTLAASATVLKQPSHRDLQGGRDAERGKKWARCFFHTVFCAIALCLLATRASADDNDSPDRVTVLLNDGGRISMQCRIIEYTGKSLRVKLKAGGTLRDYSTQQVVDIQTPQTAPHQKGLEQFAKGEIKEAKTSFEEALTIEPRDWARREILAALIRCALRQGDYTAASTRFLALVTSDPDTRYYRLAPLAWTSTEATPERRSLARQWREQKSEAHRLLAASILLFEQADAAQAETDLKTLSRSANRMVGALAHAQLWRKRVAKGDLLDDELERWQERIDEMPEEVRGGPQYVLGTGYRRLRNHNAAAAAFLWLPLIYPDDTHLAARACVEAGAELVRCGQKPEAARTYREALQRFSETPFAREASQALDELEGK